MLQKTSLEDQIVQTNPPLEAFGNAKTVRNNKDALTVSAVGGTAQGNGNAGGIPGDRRSLTGDASGARVTVTHTGTNQKRGDHAGVRLEADRGQCMQTGQLQLLAMGNQGMVLHTGLAHIQKKPSICPYQKSGV